MPIGVILIFLQKVVKNWQEKTSPTSPYMNSLKPWEININFLSLPPSLSFRFFNRNNDVGFFTRPRNSVWTNIQKSEKFIAEIIMLRAIPFFLGAKVEAAAVSR